MRIQFTIPILFRCPFVPLFTYSPLRQILIKAMFTYDPPLVSSAPTPLSKTAGLALPLLPL